MISFGSNYNCARQIKTPLALVSSLSGWQVISLNECKKNKGDEWNGIAFYVDKAANVTQTSLEPWRAVLEMYLATNILGRSQKLL